MTPISIQQIILLPKSMSSINIPKNPIVKTLSQIFQATCYCYKPSNHKLKCLRIRFQNGEEL